jgi:hypothetical protein
MTGGRLNERTPKASDKQPSFGIAFACSRRRDQLRGKGPLHLHAAAEAVKRRTAEAIGPLAPGEIPEALTLGAKPPSEQSGCHRRIHS